MSHHVLDIKNLSYRVKQEGSKKIIINNFSYTFEKEKIYTIIGPSGSGKSTLLRLINRLNEPSSGEIIFFESNQLDFNPCALRKRIGYLFQVPYLFEKTVKDNFLYVDSNLSDDAIINLLSRVHLDDSYLTQAVDQLSVGEKQRVALARLLANKPDVILLDEPTSSLDPSITDMIEKLIIEVVKSEKLTAIIVTHFPDQALRVGQEALLLVDGKLVESGTVDDVINHPQSDEGKKYKEKELR